METLFAIITLLAVPVILAYKANTEYDGIFSKCGCSSFANLLALGLLIGYVFLVLVEGKYGIYQRLSLMSEHRKFGYLFLFPGVGFGLAIFPRIAAEYTGNYINLAMTGITGIVALPGWLIIISLLIVILTP